MSHSSFWGLLLTQARSALRGGATIRGGGSKRAFRRAARLGSARLGSARLGSARLWLLDVAQRSQLLYLCIGDLRLDHFRRPWGVSGLERLQ